MSGPTTLPEVSSVVAEPRHFWRPRAAIWVALVLWLASNVFVTVISKMATWERNASYHSMADLCRWDCGWYGTVLEGGYDKAPQRQAGGAANWAFHPLFPLTAYLFRQGLNLSIPLSLVLASKAALLFAIYSFLLMVGDGAETTVHLFQAGSLVAFNPYLIYAHAGYAEPLYFALFAFAYYLASRKRWISSGIMGALLSAVRVVGFLFSISYAVVWLRDMGWRPKWRKDDAAKVIGFLLCPLGTAIYMLYLYHRTGDALAQIHIHVSFLEGRSSVNPFSMLWMSLAAHHWFRVWGVMSLAGLVACAWLFKLRKPELGVYLALSILIPLSAGFAPYGMPRYIWWQPPFLYLIYCALKRHSAGWLIYVAFASGMASFMIMEWFSGHNFVV